MNDDMYSGDLHAWIEPEIEARVVALILGEASDFEAEELERLMEERPEIRVFRRRLESVHGLLGAALHPGDDEEWKLAPEARAELFESIELKDRPEEVAVLEPAQGSGTRERRIRRASRRVFWSAAACFVLTLFFAILLQTSKTVTLHRNASEARGDERDSAAMMKSDYKFDDGFQSYENLGNRYERAESRAANGVVPPGEFGKAASPENESAVREHLAKLNETLRWDEGGESDATAIAGVLTDLVEQPADPAADPIVDKEVSEPAKGAPRPKSSPMSRVPLTSIPKTPATPSPAPAPAQPDAPEDAVDNGLGTGTVVPTIGDLPRLGRFFEEAPKSSPEPKPAPPSRGSAGRVEMPADDAIQLSLGGAVAPGQLAAEAKKKVSRDETRSRILDGIDHGWELAVPTPAESDADEAKGGLGLNEDYGALIPGYAGDGKAANRATTAAEPTDEALARGSRKRLAIRGDLESELGAGRGQGQGQGESEGQARGKSNEPGPTGGTETVEEEFELAQKQIPGGPQANTELFKKKSAQWGAPNGRLDPAGPAVAGKKASGIAPDQSVDARVDLEFHNSKAWKQTGEGKASGKLLERASRGRVRAVDRSLSLHDSSESMDLEERTTADESVTVTGGLALGPVAEKQPEVRSKSEASDKKTRFGLQNNSIETDKDGDGQPRPSFDRDIAGEPQAGHAVGGGGGFAFRWNNAKESPPETGDAGGRGLTDRRRDSAKGRKLQAAEQAQVQEKDLKTRFQTLKEATAGNLREVEELQRSLRSNTRTRNGKTVEDDYFTGAQKGKEGKDAPWSRYREGNADAERADDDRGGREKELLAELSDTIESASASGDDGRVLGGESNARKNTEFKLRNIVLPEVYFDEVTVAEAVDYLQQRSAELDVFTVDPDEPHLKYSIERARSDEESREAAEGLKEDGLARDPGQVRISGVELKNVPVEKALQSIAEKAKMKVHVDESGTVQLLPLATTGSVSRGAIDLEGRTWDIPVAAWKKIQGGQAGGEAILNANDLLAVGTDDLLNVPPREMFQWYGVTFPEGASANYVPSTGTFVVRNTSENLGLIDGLVQSSLTQVKKEQEALKKFEKSAADTPYSTFSLNVSDVSFKLAKASLDRGEWPAADKVRVEEFVNAFDYGDPAPTQTEKVACEMEQAAHPFLQQRNLLRVSMRTAALGRSAGTPLRLTVLLDNSGSMDRADRVDSVKAAFELLAGQLNPQDQVTLVSFARQPRLLADRVSGDKVTKLAQVVETRQSEGGTNIEEALQAGIAKAREQFLEGGQNRIILLTDGAANLGNAKPDDLAKLVEQMRGQGIAFDACGVGAEGLNDDILESLTRKGDGRYYFLDRPEDADAGFARQIAGALRPAARNVKVQVQFNPKRVGHYKLYGFEKHRLKKEDFRNDSVDAAEMAAEEAGNAIYQVETLPEGEGEIGTVSVRFQDMASGQMIEKKWTIPYEEQAPLLNQADPSLKLASGSALLGEKLKGSMIGEAVEMDRLSKLINSLPAAFPSDERVKHLVEMAAKVRELAPE